MSSSPRSAPLQSASSAPSKPPDLQQAGIQRKPSRGQAFQQVTTKLEKRKQLACGLLLVSLISHAIVLALPWPRKSFSSINTQFSDRAEEVPAASDPVASLSTVSLGDIPQSADSISAEVVSQSAESLQQAPSALSQSVPPPLLAQPTVQSTAPQSLSSQSTSPQSVPPQAVSPQIVPPQLTQPIVQPTAEPVPNSEPTQPLNQPAVQSENETTSPHSSTQASLKVDPTQGTVMLLGEGFPDLVGARSNCYGVAGCRQLSGNYRQAAGQLVEQLKAQGYKVSKIESVDDPGHRVFEAIAPDRPDKIYYLNVYSPDVGNTVYVMAVEILSLAQLEALSS